MKKELLSVGETAKLIGVSVRTLQYYDKENLLKPSCTSEGGRRLYTPKDIIRLHQIRSFKHLGFSLDDIRSRLLSLDDPQDFAALLLHQKKVMEEEIHDLNEALEAIDALYEEVQVSQSIDFSRYAGIIELLKVNREGYWIWDCFDDDLKQHIQTRFQDDPDGGLRLYESYQHAVDECIRLQKKGIKPDSPQGRKLGETWWNMIMEFTGGDMSLLSKLEAFNNRRDQWDKENARRQKEADAFMKQSLECYFEGLHVGDSHA